MSSAGPRRVCVLDDNAMSLEIIAASLEEQGLEVHTFSSAFDVSSQFEVLRPQLIVIDLNMPALQGDKVVDVLHRNSVHRCPVIVYSAAPEPELRRRAQACGAAGYVRKSQDASVLVRAVLQQLQQAR